MFIRCHWCYPRCVAQQLSFLLVLVGYRSAARGGTLIVVPVDCAYRKARRRRSGRETIKEKAVGMGHRKIDTSVRSARWDRFTRPLVVASWLLALCVAALVVAPLCTEHTVVAWFSRLVAVLCIQNLG